MPAASDRDEGAPGVGQPLIGVTGRRFLASAMNEDPSREMIFAGLRLDGFYASYAERLAEAGAMAVYVSRESDPRLLASRLDGLVLAGGLDVDPRLYGGRATSNSTLLDPVQDEFEIALARVAVERGLPTLGTCRGHEVLNVAFGGTLHPHLDGPSGPHHNRAIYPMADRGHAIRVEDGTVLQRLYGLEAEVNSFHHQAVDRLGEGLAAVAFAADDEVIEAIEMSGADALGVQWHPEFAAGPEPVLRWLVERAREFAAGRASAVGAESGA